MPPPSASSSAGAITSVQVALRIRPATSQDATSIPARFQRTVIHATGPTSVSVDATTVASSTGGSAPAAAPSPSKKQIFSFDQVHPPSITQHALFTSTAEPLVARFVEGFNCTILAYGQTSSGKTFTMTGVDLDADPSDPSNGMGIIPRAVSTIFSRARKLKEERGSAWNYSIKGSFIELYNEDLLDLLSVDEGSGGRREVQIREDKDGHIIWGGLREIQVKNSGEVMNLIRKGTSIRRTNETDMNAQSSRSHAIFSLTLTQKKFTGSGPSPSARSSSPLPPGGRSPSRLARPSSMMPPSSSSNRVSSPTFGRPSTPSFASGIGRGGPAGGLRPSSAMGLRPSERKNSISTGGDDDGGEWVTVVSKFHFVDLAGSERLKRTAAAGERIKEGISINSGLLALGNVISALGDPSRAKSHMASHIPYRDSKLTRLLQDSLGGNAHTLMIACVSPAEWNASETINTLKYANRARNIKNRAVVNEREDGWDDVEWLQGTVIRLRRDLKALREGGTVGTTTIHELPDGLQGAGKKVLAQMTDLQNNYEDLREKFVERTEELTRLRRELGVKQRGSSGGALAGTAKYEEIVGPVIEEYEKTISAMEAELSLNRAALRHTNEMVEEKEEELATITERHAATELYVEDLRARVAKLSERETSTEAYVRDLEEKIKSYDETSVTSSESMTDLKRSIAKYKDSENYSSKYIADLEARLARADESVLSLQQSVEQLEKEGDRRRTEVDVLQSRLENLQSDGTSWRSDLEERERKVKELEAKMAEWELKRKETGDERLRLGSMVGEVALARKSLESLTPATDGTGFVTPASGISTPNRADLSLEGQLVALQQTHTATLADLASVTAKYHDSLREISDLAAQIQEAKLSNPIVPEPLPSSDLPSIGRRLTKSRSREGSENGLNSSGRRLFYRAASSDSLHSRSLSQSLSLSQELSSARSHKASTSSHGTSPSMSHSPSRSKPNLSISLSNISISPTERSVTSLEKEIMRLQEVLNQREAEIMILEESLKEKENAPTSFNKAEAQDVDSNSSFPPETMHSFDEIRKNMVHQNGHAEPEGSEPDSDASLQRLNELMLSMAQKESQHREVVEDLTSQLAQVQRQHDDLTALSRDQTVNMSTELEGLRSKHQESILQLEKVQQHEIALTEALKKAEIDHAASIEAIRAEHEEMLRVKGAEFDELLARTKEDHGVAIAGLNEQLAQASAALEKAHQDHTVAFGKLQADHEDELQRRIKEANDVLEHTRKEHKDLVTSLRGDHEETLKKYAEEASATLQHTEEEYYNLLAKLRSDHSEALEKHKNESNATLERLREQHAGELRMAEIAREGSLTESQSSQAAALKGLQEEHSAAIARKEASFAEDLDTLRTEHARVLKAKDDDHRLKRDNLKAEHTSSLARLREESELEIERLTVALSRSHEEGKTMISKAQEEHEAAMQTLEERHTALLQEVKRNYEDEKADLTSYYDLASKEAESSALQERDSLLQSHSEEISKLTADHQAALAEVNANLIAVQEQHRNDLEDSRAQNERMAVQHKESLSASLAALEQLHAAELETLRRDHDLLVRELEDRQIAAAEKAKSEMQQLLVEERARSAAAVSDLGKKHAQEYDTLRQSHDQYAQELANHKSAAEDIAAEHELTRSSHEKTLNEKTTIITQMEQQLSGAHDERDKLQSTVVMLRAELERAKAAQASLLQDASKRESIVGELEKHRSLLAEVQENLQRVKDEKDTVQAQKSKQDSVVRDLQAQLITRTSTPERPAVAERNIAFSRVNGLPPMKLPPPTPPPSAPPPPAPKTNGDSISSQSSIMRSSTSSSRDSALESPATPSTSVAHSLANGHTSMNSAQLEKQAKHIEEQDAMIKTLNKQLSHCESDLQAHMDLVTTLETSLSDSEKNLRKARMHATELARERDMLNGQIENLRNELQTTRREVDSVRRSIAEEKQTLQQSLEEERKAKERARHQLDTRMEELQKRKSKFACL